MEAPGPAGSPSRRAQSRVNSCGHRRRDLVWAWLGGLCGGVYVLAVIFIADKVGAAVFTGLAVTAAIVTSVLLDHFGLVGFQVHAAGIGRIVGAVLMVAGLSLVCAF